MVAELAALLAEDRSVVVSGEAGIGKTTLLRTVAAESGRPVLEGGGLATLSWMTYLPLRRALGRDVADGDPTAVAADVETTVGAGVLLLDDAHWADPGTLETLTLLTGRVGVLAGVRRGDPGADSTLDRLRDAGYVDVPLRPLDTADAAGLVRTLRPDLPGAAVERLVSRTGGNPLLLRELSATGEPSASLRLALAARLRQLDDVAREVFGVVALAGRPVRSDALDEAGVKSLLAVDLLVSDGTRVSVRHALLGEIAAAEMSEELRRALHARIARAVADDGEAARHYQLAGESELAHAAALRAAQAATQPAERANHLSVAAATASGPEGDRLRLRAAFALEQAHDWDGMVATLDLLDRDDLDAQAWAHLLRARGAWAAGDGEGLRRNLDAGLELAGGTASEVEVRLRIEHTRVPLFLEADPDAAVRESGAALELARATGVDVPRARYLDGTALCTADRWEGTRQLELAIQGARETGDTSTEFLAANNLISYHESGGDPRVGRELAREYVARSHELGFGEWEYNFRVAVAELDFHAGDYEPAITEAERLVGLVREARGNDMLTETLCLSLIDVGRIDEALRRVENYTFSSDYRGEMQALWIRIEAALWDGRPARALDLVERFLTYPESDPNTVLGTSSRAWACLDLARDPGAPPPEQVRPMLHGLPLEVDGIARLHRGEHEAAERLLTRAAELWAPWHKRGELRCRWAAAEAVRRAGDTGRAVLMLETVEAEAERRGMLPLLGRIHQSLRAAGQRRSAPRTRSAGSTLTGRQQEILALVRDGLTNAQIASRLGISRHTVVAQLASASAKLGASGRAQAAVRAAQDGG